MMNRWLILGLALCGAPLIGGCGGGVKDQTTKVEVPPIVDYLKRLLQGIEASGQELGSGEGELRDALEKLRETDPAKAGELEKPLEDLYKARGEAKIKAAAKAALEKLP